MRQVCAKVDVTADCGFEDFLTPNEETPKNVKPHLDLMEEGLIVSTGTERSIYDLLLADEKRCTGLVVRDINPKVKAYIDFLVLLIRLSHSREEFVRLVDGKNVESVRALLENGSIPEPIRSYYLENLDAFAGHYFPTQHICSYGDCTGVEYWKEDALFEKLKRYADAGAIIATIGDIGELRFLKDKKVAVVDTSNIFNYSLLDLRNSRKTFHPRVIWTSSLNSTLEGFAYHSYIHYQMTYKERKRFEELTSFLKRFYDPDVLSFWLYVNLKKIDTPDEFHDICKGSYSKAVLEKMELYMDEYIVDIEGIGTISLNPLAMSLEKINQLSKEQLQALIQNKKVQAVLTFLIDSWVKLSAKTCMALMEIEDWRESFLAYMVENPAMKDYFLWMVQHKAEWRIFSRETWFEGLGRV